MGYCAGGDMLKDIVIALIAVFALAFGLTPQRVCRSGAHDNCCHSGQLRTDFSAKGAGESSPAQVAHSCCGGENTDDRLNIARVAVPQEDGADCARFAGSRCNCRMLPETPARTSSTLNYNFAVYAANDRTLELRPSLPASRAAAYPAAGRNNSPPDLHILLSTVCLLI